MRHALRNAAVPIVTVIGIGVALLIGGVVVTESVFTHSRPRPPHRRRRARARLPDHPGRDPAVLGRLRADQPAGRPALHRARSEDPLLSVDADAIGSRSPPAAAATARRRAAPARCAIRASSSARSILAVIVLDRRRWRRCSAPSIRPRSIPRSATRCRAPSSTIRADDGTKSTRRALDGHRHARPRRLQPRRLRRARVADRRRRGRASISVAIGLVIGLVAGYIRWLDGDHHAHHGRADGDPGDPARHRAGLAVARRPRRP